MSEQVIRIATIAEGQSDQNVIENILYGHLHEFRDRLRFNHLQPAGDEPGGWTLVFDSLRRGDPQIAFQANADLLIIHIDTDVQDEKGYEVPRREHGKPLPLETIVERVTERLIEEIDETVYNSHRDRIVFAIAVDSIECWLLPLLHPEKKEDSKARKTTGCLAAANKALRAANEKGLSSSDNQKFPAAYKKASRDYTRTEILNQHRTRNPSLDIFLRNVELARDYLATLTAPTTDQPTDPNTPTE